MTRSPRAMRNAVSAARPEFRDAVVYSSVFLAPGGHGSTKMFTCPRGAPMSALVPATWGTKKTAILDERYTNLTRVGELGVALGDMAIKSISVEAEIAPGAIGDRACVEAETHLSLRIAGKEMWAAPTTQFATEFEMPILCGRCDTIEVRVEAPAPLTIKKPVILRVYLRGIIARDIV